MRWYGSQSPRDFVRDFPPGGHARLTSNGCGFSCRERNRYSHPVGASFSAGRGAAIAIQSGLISRPGAETQ